MLRCRSTSGVRTGFVEHPLFNMISIAGIHCVHCGMTVHPDSFSEHSRSHFPGMNRAQRTSNRAPSKISLDVLLRGDQNDEEPGIRSLLPDEMPKKQKTKKPAPVIDEPNPIMWTGETLKELNTFEETYQTHEIENEFDDSPIAREIEALQSLKKKVNVKKETAKIHHKHPHFFQKEHANAPLIDEFRSPQKTMREKTENAELGYAVEAVIKIENPKLSVRIAPTKKNINKSKVGTISTRSSFFSQSQNTEIGGKRDWRLENRFECKGCKGFYCGDCGSDIPPAFRPVDVGLLSTIEHQQMPGFFGEHLKHCRTNSRFTGCPTCTH